VGGIAGDVEGVGRGGDYLGGEESDVGTKQFQCVTVGSSGGIRAKEGRE